jgi:hypothetical protein
MKFGQLESAVAVWSPHHGDVGPHIVEPNNAVHPRPLDYSLAFQLQTKFKEKNNSSLKVVDDDADIVHPLDRHRTNVDQSLRNIQSKGIGTEVAQMEKVAVRPLW